MALNIELLKKIAETPGISGREDKEGNGGRS
jgi:hypothetical protein